MTEMCTCVDVYHRHIVLSIQIHGSFLYRTMRSQIAVVHHIIILRIHSQIFWNYSKQSSFPLDIFVLNNIYPEHKQFLIY